MIFSQAIDSMESMPGSVLKFKKLDSVCSGEGWCWLAVQTIKLQTRPETDSSELLDNPKTKALKVSGLQKYKQLPLSPFPG
jgi:hypothetical protein